MTIPLYIQNAYLKEMEAQIIDVANESENRWKVELDKTVFYPMSGGQPTDQGKLFTEHWEGKVYQVLQKADKIIHFIEGSEPPPLGSAVKGVIDWERRYLNMRLHSAAHVVDFALFLLGLSPNLLMPLKGDSGKKPTIWYQGILDKDFREDLEQKANELVLLNLPFSFRFVSHEELEREALYLQPGLPKDKPLRLLTLKDIGSVADGGTQVKSTAEVGHISILPLEKKDGMTLVHYRCV